MFTSGPIRRLVTALLATSAAAAALVGVTASPASAEDVWDTDARCQIDDFSPRTVTVGTTPVVKTFDVSASECNMQGWSVDVDRGPVYAYDGNPSEVIHPYSNSDAGSYDVIVEADNADWNTTSRVFTNGFHLKRATYFQTKSFNVSPEPVKKGKNLTVKTRLKVADWDNDRNVGYGKQTVKIEFRANGTSTWKTIKTVKTSSTGGVSTKVKASKSGTYRASYAGSSKTGASTSGTDAVTVK